MDKDFEGLYQNLIVPTSATTCQRFLLNLHVLAKKGVLYVGKAGTGKTTNVKDFLCTLNSDNTLSASMSFNSYTDSKTLQTLLESQIVKQAGKNYGPPPGKVLIYFLDDLNMPQRDKYETQAPISLIRQIVDHELVYNREALEEQRFIKGTMFFGAMNPKSGSFFIDTRLSRHLTLVSCLTAEREVLTQIYLQILENHMVPFDKQCSDLAPRIIKATMAVFMQMANSPQFMPTAQKFHYQFNLRDFAKIVQNMLQAVPSIYKGNPKGLARMWAHECHRVWQDRLIKPEDHVAYMNFMRTGCKEFGDIKEDDILAEPLIYTSFVAQCEGHDATYMEIKGLDHLKEVLESKLEEYNEQVQSMKLVLFTDAMAHVCKIARIVGLPCGNALLVGVGGSGKQSLAKLSAFILTYDVMRIQVNNTYNKNDLKTDIQNMYQKAGVTGQQLLFIITDGQIPKDEFLVYFNDLLSSGWIPELFPAEELDAILGKLRAEAKGQGVADNMDAILEYFQDKGRKNLHIALCFSPVGPRFRVWARMFPGLINATTIDWF
jgi:dynein heavy chain